MNDQPKRIQRKRTKGWRMPANTVYVGRPTKWGNSYPIQCFGGKAGVVAMYRKFITWPDNPLAMELRAQLGDLRGKDLCCWCPLDQPCHADVLLELANSESIRGARA